jgi:hypothetical protein
MTENPAFTERMENDGIRIVPELTETLYQNNDRSWTWRVTLGKYEGASYGQTIEVTYTNNRLAGDSTPDEHDVFWCLISDATGIEGLTGNRDFIDWAREYYEFPDKDLKDSTTAWDWVERAQTTYNNIVRDTANLALFLGDKFDAYKHETEFDV